MKFLIAGLLAALLPTLASATTVRRVDVAEMVDASDLIFSGTVVDSRVVPSQDGSYPFTFVTFVVNEVLKGKTQERRLTLRFDGGQLGAEVFSVEGMPTFEVGRSYLTFVEGNGLFNCPVVGMWQGKLDFVRHPVSGEMVLVDHSRAPLKGIERGAWVRSSQRFTSSGTLRPSHRPEVKVLEQNGVQIIEEPARLETEANAEEIPSSARVLNALRTLIRQREAMPGFKSGKLVESADARAVPQNRSFQAAPSQPR